MGSQSGHSFAANDLMAQRYDRINGHVLSCSAYPASSATGSMRMALYADRGGLPGALIEETETKAFSSTSSGHWEEFSFAVPPVINNGVKYWVACHTSATVGSCSPSSSQTDGRRFKSSAFGSGLPDPFGAASSYSNTRGIKMKVQT